MLGGYSPSYEVSAPYKIRFQDICDSFSDNEYDILEPILKDITILLTVEKNSENRSLGFPEYCTIIKWTRGELPSIVNLFSDSIDRAIDEYLNNNEESICESSPVQSAINSIQDYMGIISEDSYLERRFMR